MIELPNIVRESAGARQTVGEGKVLPTPDRYQGAPQRPQVLLVDDHHDTAEALRNYLGRVGYDVTVAPNIGAACQCFEQKSFDLLLCDIGLPDGRGEHLLQRVRDAGHQFPAIALTGFGAEADVERSRAAGFHAHLTKPFLPQQLKHAVEEALRGVGI